MAVPALAAGCSARRAIPEPGSAPSRSGSTPPATSIDDVDGFLGWMEANRRHVGLSVTAAGEQVAAWNADERFPLASTAKVLTLLAAGDAVARGELRPDDVIPAKDVERWYWPGTDGGSHPAALAELAERGAKQMTLRDLAWAAIRWSDNAAADELLHRSGGPEATAEVARRASMTQQEPMRPILGDFLAWSLEPDAWLTGDAAARTRLSTRLAQRGLAEARRPQAPPLLRQRDLARTAVGGAPAEWSRLMDRLVGEPAAPSSAFVRDALEWPLRAFSENAKSFARFGTKGGSLPGVRVQASYLQPHGEPPVAVALFLRDLPADVERRLGESYVDQQLVRRVALDAPFRERLSAPGG